MTGLEAFTPMAGVPFRVSRVPAAKADLVGDSVTITQFIAALLYASSLEVPVSHRYRYTYARRDLMRTLRGIR